MINNFTNEQKLVLIASRLGDDIDPTMLESILNSDIDWSEVLRIASKNKVLYLLYENIVNLGFLKHIPKYFASLLEDACYCNVIRNSEKLAELNKLMTGINDSKIKAAPVKGGYLIDNLYNNRRARVTNDIDILIKRENIKQIDMIMKKMEYTSGEIDEKSDSVVPPKQTKKVLYKTKMYDLLPYAKHSTVMSKGFIIFDFSFAFDFGLDLSPVNEMLDSVGVTNGCNELLPEHFFIHMCCHHYREATHTEWIKMGKDLTLMKFCDVREFVRKKMDAQALERALLFAKKHNLQKAVYFTVYFLKMIYNDGYEDRVLSSISINDDDFMYCFSDDGKGEQTKRKKDFWASLFSDNNFDEIEKSRKYESLM